MNSFNVIDEAKNIFNKEIDALALTRDSLGENFETILNIIIECTGKIVLTGIGKPGHIGSKMAATFSSLGTPAFFMHPAEALHGDLGMVEKKDVVFLMSYSGESVEVISLLPTLQEIGCTLIAFTGKPNSTLAKACHHSFCFPDFEEACYMHLAPTSSTTALLVLGDALAVVASRLRNYTKENFCFYHPSGALGKKLSVKVSDLMYSGDHNAVVESGVFLRNAIVEMSTKGLNMVTVTNENGQVCGIITDGDLKRMLEKNLDVYNVIVDDVMTKNPKCIDYREMAVNALQKMSDKRITCMPVIDDDNRAVGTILMQDIFKAGIVK